MSVKKITNDLFLRAAKGEVVERPPVWLMRQAGRVLPEYRATRSKAKNFIAFVKNPELAAEVTIQPVDILGVDAAIIFSDILVIPEAMGLPYQMIESKGPWFENTITNTTDVERLHVCDGSELKYVTDAIALAKQQLNNRVPLIGFAGAPFTILAYMVEGSGSKTFSKAKAFLYQQPAAAHLLLEKIAHSTIHYLKAQIAAGADLIQLFDSWAGVLSPDMYSEFSLKYISMICDAIDEVPKTVFAKGANFALSEMRHLNCDVLGLDWNIHPADARALTGNKVLQGNADPCLLYASEEKIVTETHAMLKAFGKQKYIANLGHGLYPDIEKEKVKLYVDTIKNYK
jgi:uroporphyrinogen decarboxylase